MTPLKKSFTLEELAHATEVQPNVIAILARSYGVTVAELKGLMAAGKIDREDVLRRVD